MSDAPWADLPPDLAQTLRPVVPALAEEIIVAVGQGVEDYVRPLEGPFGHALRTGVERALDRFLDLIDHPERDSPRSRRIYVQLGRGEFQSGRSLDALLSAYRLGARLAWRRYVEAGKQAGVDPDVLYRLGEAIFAYIDGLSAESIEGYAAAQSEAAGARSRERRRVVGLLLADPPADEHGVEAAAERAGWRLPDRVSVLAVQDVDPDLLASRLGTGTIAAEVDGVVVAIVPDATAPGRRRQLEAAVDGPGALGPSGGWRELPASAARARLGLRLLTEGALPGPFLATDDRLAELLVHVDGRLAADLAAAALSPLDDLQPRQREKLEATLRAWLDHQGRAEDAAAALGVHGQTVRYRLVRLRELFGDRLDDPEERFSLGLALRARAAVSPP